MEEDLKIQMWGCSKDGQGFVQDLGIYDSIEDVSIHTNMFADTHITFEYVIPPKKDEDKQ